MTVLEQLRKTIEDGHPGETEKLVREALKQHIPAGRIVEEAMTPAMRTVGENYKSNGADIIKILAAARSVRKKKEEQATDGTLYCAGMIAGEGLVGILLAILAVVNVSSVFDLSGSINLGNAGGVILMLLMILSLLKFSIWNKKKA